jgi:DNA-binding transcriptional LysR family regulator
MKIETLNEFVVLVKHMNFSRASKDLYCSQPALSSRIQALEKELGFALLDRRGTYFGLTSAGMEFLKFACLTVEAYEKTLPACQQLAKERPPVRVCGILPDSREDQLLQEIEEIPFTFIDLEFDESLLSAFEKNQVDAGFSYDITLSPALKKQAEDLGLAWFSAHSAPIAVCFMATHSLAAKERLSREDFKGCTFRIHSGKHFDAWKQVLLAMFGKDSDLQFQLYPLESASSLSLTDLGDTVYACGEREIKEMLSHRSDVRICTEIDGLDLMPPSLFVYHKDSSNPNVLTLADRIRQCI